MTPPPDGDRYVTSSQIAAELGVHVQTVQKYFREDGLPGRKVGKEWRTTRAAFDRWLEGAPADTTVTIEHGHLELETKDVGAAVTDTLTRHADRKSPR